MALDREFERPVRFLGIAMDPGTRWNFLCEVTYACGIGCFIGVVAPFTLPLAIRMGATPLQVGLVTAAPFIANLLSPVWAALSQHARKVPWVALPNLLWCSLLSLVGLTTHPAALTGLVLAGNMSAAAGNPAYAALVQEVYPAAIRGRLMGYVRLAMAGAMLPVTLIAGHLIDRHGPVWLYLSSGLATALGIGVYAQTREPAGAPAPTGTAAIARPLQGVRLAMSDASFRRFLLAVLVVHGGALMAAPLYPVFQVRRLGLTNESIGVLAATLNVAWLCAYGIWGRVIDRHGARFAVLGAAVFYLGMPLAYGLFASRYPLILLGTLCQGIADAALDLGVWNVILAVDAAHVRYYTSTTMTAAGIRGALAPLLGSWLLQVAGFEATFVLAAVLVAAGLLLLITAHPGQGRFG